MTKQLILSNSSTLINQINTKLATIKDATDFIAEDFYTVTQGKGTRKEQLILTITKQGEYTVNLIFNTSTLEFIKANPLGKYNKELTHDMDIAAYWLYTYYIQSIITDLFNSITLETITTEEDTNTTNEQPAQQTETSYTVGNRSFATYAEAELYCLQSDFDTDIIEEVNASSQASNSHLYQSNHKALDLQYFSSIDTSHTLHYNSYDPVNLSHTEWEKDVSKHNAMYYNLKDKEVINQDDISLLIEDGYNFWISVKNNNPYFNKDCYLISLQLSYINKSINTYVNKDYYNTLTN